MRRLSPPLLASKATFDRLPQVVCCLCSNLNSWLVACFDRRVVCTLLKRGSWGGGTCVIPRLTCRNVTRYTRNFTLTLTHIMNVHNCSILYTFFFRSREDYDEWDRSPGPRLRPATRPPLRPSRSVLQVQLLLLARPHTNSLNHRSQPNRLTLHPATNRNLRLRYPYPSGARLDIVTCTSKL